MNAIRILTGKVEREEIELNYRVSREVNLKKKKQHIHKHTRTHTARNISIECYHGEEEKWCKKARMNQA